MIVQKLKNLESNLKQVSHILDLKVRAVPPPVHTIQNISPPSHLREKAGIQE